MGDSSWFLLTAAIAFLCGIAFLWRPLRLAIRRPRLAEARRDFHWQRERLETKFVLLAQGHVQPGTPYWDECEFDNAVAYVRNRSTGELSAFVAIVVPIEEIQKAPAGLPEMAKTYRSATAVFRFNGRHWDTDGRAIFNLSPSETIRFYRRNLVMVDQEQAEQS